MVEYGTSTRGYLVVTPRVHAQMLKLQITGTVFSAFRADIPVAPVFEL